MKPDEQKNYIYLSRNSLNELLKASDDIFIKHVSDLQSFKTLPLKAHISTEYFENDIFTDELERNVKRRRIHSLKNTLDRNSLKSLHYKTSSSFGDKLTQELTLISIPSIFYGSSIKKGSVELAINYGGQNLAIAKDLKENGEIIETSGTNSGSVAGVVLYEHGFIVLTGSWDQNTYITDPDTLETYEIGSRWNCYGKDTDTMQEKSFDISFNGVNEINTLTMLAHAEKGELNHSNNPTYVKYGQDTSVIASDNSYFEYDKKEIKNITKYEYDNFSGSLEKQTYISKIAIYDDQKNLIGIAKLSKPIRKSESRDFTFKMKLDI